MNKPSILKSSDIGKQLLQTFFLIESALFAIAGIIWWLDTQHTRNNFSNQLFVVSCLGFCIGALFVIASTSQRRYYKYLRDKSRGKANAEENFESETKNRKKYVSFGIVLSSTGIIGMVLSGVVLYL